MTPTQFQHIRHMLGLSQKDLAQIMGVSPGRTGGGCVVYNWERNRCNMPKGGLDPARFPKGKNRIPGTAAACLILIQHIGVEEALKLLRDHPMLVNHKADREEPGAPVAPPVVGRRRADRFRNNWSSLDQDIAADQEEQA